MNRIPTVKTIYLILFISFFVSGCFPCMFTKTPALTGKVIEKESKQPIQGASIYFENFPDNKVLTQKDGSFYITENEEKGYFILLGAFDPMLPHGNLVITKEGYSPYKLEIGHGRLVEGNIELQKE